MDAVESNLCHCRRRAEEGSCSCFPAKFMDIKCGECNEVIQCGDCIQRPCDRWNHTRCRKDEDRGAPAIIRHLISRSQHEYVHVPLLALEGTPKRAHASIEYPSESVGTRRNFRDFSCPGVQDSAASSGTTDQDLHCEDDTTRGQEHSLMVKKIKRSSEHYTREQDEFSSFDAPQGSIVRCKAYAGCGKTTSAALLCCRLSQRSPGAKILYLQFGRSNMIEAKRGNKFGKNVHIYTTHGYALKEIARKCGCSAANCAKCTPKGSHSAEDVMSALRLEQEVAVRLGATMPVGKRRKVAVRVARFVNKTLLRFCQSADEWIECKHVDFLARPQATDRSIWKETMAADDYRVYTDGAKRLWDKMDRGTVSMTHDFYLKKFQLAKIDVGVLPRWQSPPPCRKCNADMRRCAGFNNHEYLECCNPSCKATQHCGFDFIILDEAQDLTPCQAAAFWHQPAGKQCVIYLLGDERQRMYRWRGVRDDFKNTRTVRDCTLSNSFRFGVNIGDAATRILMHADARARVRGVAQEAGRVVREVTALGPARGELAVVVVTRSNKGMISELLHRRRIMGRWPRWSLVDERCKVLVDLARYRKYVDLYRGEAQQIRVKGEAFDDWEELKTFVEEELREEDAFLLSMLLIIEELEQVELPCGVDVLAEAEQHRVVEWRANAHDQTTSAVSSDVEVLLTTAHKAKGMEFDSVLVGRDFGAKLPVVNMTTGFSDDVSRIKLMQRCDMGEYEVEESNMLYVAATRARRELQLPHMLWHYLQMLEATFPDLESPAPPEGEDKAHQPVSVERWREAREKTMRRWEEFRERFAGPGASLKRVRFEDIAWPDPGVLAVGGVGAREVKELARWLLRRFHPDKFLSQFSVDTSDAGVSAVLRAWCEGARAMWSSRGTDCPSDS